MSEPLLPLYLNLDEVVCLEIAVGVMRAFMRGDPEAADYAIDFVARAGSGREQVLQSLATALAEMETDLGQPADEPVDDLDQGGGSGGDG